MRVLSLKRYRLPSTTYRTASFSAISWAPRELPLNENAVVRATTNAFGICASLVVTSSVSESANRASSGRSPKLSNGNTTIDNRGALATGGARTVEEGFSEANLAIAGGEDWGGLVERVHHVTPPITSATEAATTVPISAVRRCARAGVVTPVAGNSRMASGRNA